MVRALRRYVALPHGERACFATMLIIA